MRLTRLDFLNRFTDAELAGIFAAAKQSIALEVWLAKFNAATPEADGTSIDACDERTIVGIHMLESAGLIGSGRANEILNTGGVALPPLALGKFRVLPPFDESFPFEYAVIEVIENQDGTTTYILDQEAGGFDPSHLESV